MNRKIFSAGRLGRNTGQWGLQHGSVAAAPMRARAFAGRERGMQLRFESAGPTGGSPIRIGAHRCASAKGSSAGKNGSTISSAIPAFLISTFPPPMLRLLGDLCGSSSVPEFVSSR